jgi:diguanylate cyclase (GGDEF)-like protein
VSAEPSISPNGIDPALQETAEKADSLGMRATTRANPALEDALERAAALCRSLARDIPNTALMVVDRDLRVRGAAGPRWERAGFDPSTLVGHELDRALPPDVIAAVRPQIEAVLAGETRHFGLPDRPGFRVNMVPVYTDAGDIAGALTLGWDESEELHAQRLAAAELERRLTQQSAVAKLGELALQRPPFADLADATLTAIVEGLEIELSSILHLSADRRYGRLTAGAGWPDGFDGAEYALETTITEADLARYAEEPLIIRDLPSDDRFNATALRHAGIVSSATVLVGHRDAPAALLSACSRTDREFSQQDLDFLRAVAHVLNGAIEGRRIEERIRHDALHDALTGLPNRTLLLERLRRAIEAADAEGRRIALFFLDVDHLKVINDSLGHYAGDELLRAIGPRLRAVLRPTDTIARFGGDEFAVLCDAVEDEAQALRVAERLVRAFSMPFDVGGEPRFCSASVGIVVSDPAGTRGPDELLSDADAAMYRAKDRGRGRHEVFDARLRAAITSRLRLEADLRRALGHEDQLWVAYQPFHRLPDRSLAGVEALLRWDHPERGAIPPSEFIPVAEDSGLIVDLGEFVLRTACRQVAEWHESGAPDLRLTVNVSARQMALCGIPGTVGAALRETGLAPTALGLEITEGLLLEDVSDTAETLGALRAMGVRLMLDDFGTGFSSLGYLRRYPIDLIKIDRSFVNDLGEDGAGDAAIVEAIVGMAKALGMGVIPEGVETEGQLERLTGLGCDFAQGFHLGRPMAASELGPLL